jgi:hypothetical protein
MLAARSHSYCQTKRMGYDCFIQTSFSRSFLDGRSGRNRPGVLSILVGAFGISKRYHRDRLSMTPDLNPHSSLHPIASRPPQPRVLKRKTWMRNIIDGVSVQ